MNIARPGRRSIIGGGLALALVAGSQIVLLAPSASASVTFNVTTTADIAANQYACGNNTTTTPHDPNSLSLREAACLANNIGGTAIINIPAGTYTLTSGHLLVGLKSGQNVTLSGAGAASTTITAGGNSGVLDFDDNLTGGVTGTVTGLTITGGAESTFGGAGIIAGSSTLSTADSLIVTNSVITGNAANGTTPNQTANPGGGIQFIGGTLSISNSTISSNSSKSSPGAGVAYIAEGWAVPESLTITNTTFSGNTMTNTNGTNVNNGGALYVEGPATTSMHVSDSTFTNNTVTATTGGAQGAAIRELNGSLTVSESTFTGNSVTGGSSTPVGGAIAVTTGTATLQYNRITGNVAGGGQALYVGTGAGSVNATENWFGCNGGPGTTGCDTVLASAPATASLSPRLVLTGSAGSSTVVGPNATTSVTGSFTTDSLGGAVSGANLSAFDGKSAGFTDPQPSPASVSSPTAAFGNETGSASTTYNSQSSSGPGHVVVGFDSASVTVPITVNRAPAVTTNPSNQSVNSGATATFSAAASGYPTPTVQWQRSTDGGVSYSDIGAATSTTYSFTAASADNGNKYRAVFTNSVSSATSTAATLTVATPPAFTSGSTATFVAGTSGSFSITTSGTPTVTSITKTGTLPSGLTFTDNGDGTAKIAGTPATGTGGTYPITLTATNGVAPDATQNLSVQVNEAPAITTNPSDQSVNPGNPVTFTAAATGTPTPTVQWQRSTDGGASYSNIGAATNTSYSFNAAQTDNGNMYRAVFTNTVGSATTTAATLSVGTAPAFTSNNATTFTVGTPGNFAITTSGVPNAAISKTGTTPSWLTLTDNGDGTGSLTGTPPAGAGNTYTFTLHATNGFSPAASQTFTLTVDEAPTITSANHATFTLGSAGSFAVTTTAGYPTATAINESGSLPSGVTLTDNNDGTATLAGTPAAGTSGSYPIVIHANAVGGTTSPASQNFTLTVNGPPAITSANHTTFAVGTAGTFTVTTAGTPAVTSISKTGTLPSGVGFVDNGDGTATLSGTPAAGTGGSYPLTITASNGITPNAVQSFTLTVNQPPTITSANHTTFTKNASSAFTVTTAPGVPASTTISETGTLPAGITLTDKGDGTATLGGTPTASGVFPITIKASNGVSPDATQSFTLTVNGPPAITSADHTTFTAGSHGTFTVTTTAGTPSATTLSKTGTLPSGVTFTDNGNGTATLSGTPAAGTGGSYPITITASNGVTPDATQSFTLTVHEPPTITSADHVTFTKNAVSSFTVTTSAGFPAATTISKSGTLPPGTAFTDNGDGTATLHGTPTTDGAYTFTITASNGVAPDATQSFTATVNGAPTITSADHTTFTVGTAGTFTVTTTAGTPATTTLSKTGTLPSGVTFTDNGNGTATLAGTPAAGTGGAYPITITASNGVNPDATQSFTLTINQAPAITTADHVTFKVGTFSTFGVGSTGNPDPALSEAGALPSGVTFTDHGDGTATLAGTPAAGTGGSYPFTITANNGVAPNATQSFTLTVNGPPTITSADHTTFTVGTSGTFTVTTTAGTPATTTLSKTGTLPSGVTFTDNGNGTATLAGTPAAGTGGSYPITITASNGISPDATQSFALTINQAPAITTADHTTFKVGVFGTFGVGSTGNPAAGLSEAGALPSGVTFTDHGDGTATLAGTPAAGTNGSYPITITANNGVAPNATQSFTLTVNDPPKITSADHTTFAVGTTGTFTVTTTAGTPATTTLSKTGTLPSGVTFTDNGNGTATLAGTPAAGTGGSYPITITASNGVAPDATQSFTLTVTELPAISSANHTTFTVGTAGSFGVTTNAGFPTATTLGETGTLPSGVSFTDNGNGTATLAGTPAAGSGGSYPITIRATNTAGHTDQSFTLTVHEAPGITSADHTTFTVGTSGTFTVTTGAGFPTPPALSKTGTLPSGVTFTDNGNGTATLAGIPAAGTGGSYPITITASNGVNPDATQSFVLTINQAPAITTADHVTFKVGVFGTFGVGSTGNPAAGLSEAGALPSGVTFTDHGDGTATLAGTPTASGVYPITIKASNGVTPDATQSFTLTVNGPPTITSADHTTFAVGSGGTFTVTTTAGTPATTTLSKTGTLPSGVTFTDNSNGTATLAGTPAAGTGGSYPVTITASNGVSPDATQSFTLTVTELPAISSANHATFTVGSAGSFGVTTNAGFPTATTLGETGTLPSGVSFTDNGNGTATLAGTPSAGSGGSYPITFTASNTAGHTDQSFTLTVGDTTGITSADHTTFTVDTAGSFTVTTAGGFPTPPALSQAGALPSGVTFHDNGNGTATLAGTPAAGTGGAYPITITASNGVKPDATQSFTLTVNQPPVITSADHTTFTIGTAGSFTVTTTGHPASSLTEVGGLPSGVTFTDHGDGTATLAGTPAAGTSGSYPFTITANNGVAPNATQSFTLTVVKAQQTITITSTPPAHPVANGPDYTITATSDSGLTVAFTIDSATTNSACSISGATVSFDHAGSCVIDANQGGDSTYQPAPQVQQTLSVAAVATSVAVVSSTSPSVFGQAAHVTATVSAGSGTPDGSVQFAVNGHNLGAPVTVSGGQAVSSDLTDSGGHPLAPGSHPVTAAFTPTDTTTYAGSSNSVTQVVNKAHTITAIAVHRTTITATVTAVAPGAGTPSGSVEFSIGGSSVGSANLVHGVATLHRSVPSGTTRHVGASYGGDTDFSGSSDSTSRHDPRIKAHVTGTPAHTRFGWYRGTVTITFTCTTNGAPLTKPCPSAVTLSHNGGGQSVTRTISSTDGGVDTVVVSDINIDHTMPRVRVAGVHNGATYDTAPKLECVARDALSGIAACRLTKHTSGSTTTYRATATDKAGNTRTVAGEYHLQTTTLEGAKLVDGAYNVKLGHTYTIVVHSIKRPTYYDAAPAPTIPFKRDQRFLAAGKHRWALGVTIEQNLNHYKYWNLGVKIGKTMHVIRIRVS